MDLVELVYRDFTKLTAKNLADYKRRWAKRLGKTPKNSQILAAYKLLVRQGELKRSRKFEQVLRIKRVRSLSGVTPFAVMTKPFWCPGECTYCPLVSGMPKSYLSDEPAAQRGKTHGFDPTLQVKDRLKQLRETGHTTDKIELIVIGGTFSAYPDSYKRKFFKGMIDACNGIASKSLFEAQKINETAKHRIVGISVETRPDWINPKEVVLMRKLGVTKVQVGVQAFDEKILRRVKRGHSLKPVAEATRMLRNAGIKVCYHLMPNLPGSDPKHDVEMAKIMYTDRRFKPDFLKLYPVVVIPGTELYREWERGEYVPYDDETLKGVLKKIKMITPYWVRIDRLVRDISKGWIEAGSIRTNMRQIIQRELKEAGKACKCIRCREVKQARFDGKSKLKMRKIDTLGGKELFLSFEDEQHLYSLLRLRLPNRDQKMLFNELKGAALLREIHTYGTVVGFKEREKGKAQHKGLGKTLLEKAEKIARKEGYKKIAVISAIGTRNYYCKQGYELEGLYMTKLL
jgi:elongator complex protein 3